MKRLQSVLAGCLVLGLLGCGGSTTKKAELTNKEKIVGTWEFVKTAEEKGAPPPGTTFEFTKDGKLIMTMKLGEKEVKMDATYTADGDKLTITGKGPKGNEKTDTDTITKLTDKELHTKNAKGQTTEFKKK
jgi:uncharacterized protein (TIGR03066 family)